VVAINRNDWSQSIVIGGRNQPVRAGLYDEMRTGRPRTVEDEAVADLITKTLARKPKAATHWSVRAIAKETGITKSTVHRLFQLFGLQPHRTRNFKLSTDPFFVEKLRDVVGLYLNPPDKAVVLCVDEKRDPMGSG
jgi:putative transposase